MKKLIRDKLPDLVFAKEGRSMDVYIEPSNEVYIQLLKLKLIEEATEVREATSHEHLVEELADVLEVLKALCEAVGAEESVFEAREKKFNERGGFEKKIVLNY
jgi:predicted house-cleaning noncanonical NTP pyrophosphatase (MazG superfamily)